MGNELINKLEALEDFSGPPPEEHLAKLTEFETKYRVEPHLLTEFKRIVGTVTLLEKFLYVEGPDEYWIRDENFARYRRPEHGLDNNRAELTMKMKPKGAKNNIIRREWNWRVDGTPPETIREGLKDLGFVFNFSVWKSCHIYNFDDATLVFYTVYDTTSGKASKTDSFVEIEVSEEHVSEMTETQAWTIIEKYEKILEGIDITPQKRMRRSLFEIYVR
jgi:adenylate cyclase class IV